jgi:hypothetical protein
MGISASTASRWFREDEDFAAQVEQARSQFLASRLDLIQQAETASGRADWRAHAWLLERTFPDEYGKNRKATPDAAECQPAPSSGPHSSGGLDWSPGCILTPAHLVILQAKRAADLSALHEAAAEKRAAAAEAALAAHLASSSSTSNPDSHSTTAPNGEPGLSGSYPSYQSQESYPPAPNPTAPAASSAQPSSNPPSNNPSSSAPPYCSALDPNSPWFGCTLPDDLLVAQSVALAAKSAPPSAPASNSAN